MHQIHFTFFRKVHISDYTDSPRWHHKYIVMIWGKQYVFHINVGYLCFLVLIMQHRFYLQ